jgi:hypothetical protein
VTREQLAHAIEGAIHMCAERRASEPRARLAAQLRHYLQAHGMEENSAARMAFRLAHAPDTAKEREP